MREDTVYLVTDQHNDVSIKSYERNQRYMRKTKIKTELIEFLIKVWSHPNRFVCLFYPQSVLYVYDASKFYKLTCEDEVKVIISSEEDSLATQEEADTEVFLSAQHASLNRNQSVCIATVDRNIVIYALYFQDTIDVRMYVRIGVGDRKRILDISDIAFVKK